jgi:hypothetical protein
MSPAEADKWWEAMVRRGGWPKRGPRFDVTETGGKLRIRRYLKRVHLRGSEGGTLYVGERLSVKVDCFGKPGPGFYVSIMPFETETGADSAWSMKEGIEVAKRRLLAQDAAARLGAKL